jgi:hypothetical protein
MPEQMPSMTVEERLAVLEKEVAQLRQQVDQLAKPQGNWLDRISGSMKDIPADVWEEFQKLCKEVRYADRPPDDKP